MTDALAPAHVIPLLAGRFGKTYLYREACESTQRLLSSDDPEGAVAVCEEQTAGRGRLGRRWEAPPSTALLCSILLRPPAERRLAELSLVGGVAAAQLVEAATGLSAQIKWPNDVMLDHRKVAGVLAEAREGVVLLGVGLNVNQQPSELPAGSSVPAASLFTVDGIRRDRAPLLAGLLVRLERAYDRWCEGGLPDLAREVGERDFLRGRRVAVGGLSGIAAGVEPDGRLAVDIGGGRRLVESGDVTYEG